MAVYIQPFQNISKSDGAQVRKNASLGEMFNQPAKKTTANACRRFINENRIRAIPWCITGSIASLFNADPEIVLNGIKNKRKVKHHIKNGKS
ncbi:hypothetical protein [Mucilaginibacter sp.]|uniref:hypothetical protein n=1 Tax=Mucilaginibacter sp. TaxID=1882438 RepID=UPI00262B9246|nr:hypothetical protein [Mucilaginibacter sp.]MDB4924427.1 hypothetical protein [Mucilaginibacter sp.]